MKWIKHLKRIIRQDKKVDNQDNVDFQKSDSQILKGEIKDLEKIHTSYNFESFSKLKVYKQPIINDVNERKQLYHQISKEIKKLD